MVDDDSDRGTPARIGRHRRGTPWRCAHVPPCRPLLGQARVAGATCLSFSLAVFVGYAATVVFWQLWTPWWAGDHIGLSPGTDFEMMIEGDNARVCESCIDKFYKMLEEQRVDREH